MRRLWTCWISAMLLAGAPAAAQGGFTFASAEQGGDSLGIYTAGGTVYRRGPGWSPVGSIMAFHLQYPVGQPELGSVRGIVPSLGARYQGTWAAVQLNAGYGFLSSELPEGAGEGPKAGASTALFVDVFPTRRAAIQGIGSYNWGDRYYWARGRATRGLGSEQTQSVRLGIEGTVQGHSETPAAAGYHTAQLAPLVEVRLGRSLRGGGSVGPKRVQRGGTNATTAWSARLELVWIR